MLRLRTSSLCALRASRLGVWLGSLLVLCAAAGLSACDNGGIEGETGPNAAPDTELSVRTDDLGGTLGDRRLRSMVEAAWSGTDSDGYVVAYDVRSYQEGEAPGPETGWNRTTRRDSTILLPIPPGESTADVVVEVRAIDNRGAVDEDPARTVFPIRNSPPVLSLAEAEAPPDTTWPVVSFAWMASDPDGDDDLAAIEVALNDSTQFVRLPPDADFLTLVATDPRMMGTVEAEVYLGRSFQSTSIRLPGLRMGQPNRIYIRSVDQTDTTSVLRRYPAEDEPGFVVRSVTSSTLLVNDYRSDADQQVLAVAREALALHGTTRYDEWDLSETPQNAASPRFSEALPGTVDPTLRQILALWDRIYWVSNAATNSVSGNNLPRAASVIDLFFSRGGRMMVQVPATLPASGDEATGANNPALNILPLSDLITFPPGVRALRANQGTPVRPAEPVPGTSQTLPELRAARLLTGTLPYELGPDDVPLYRISFYENNNQDATWQGTEVVASMRSDRRVGLFALPLFAGAAPLFESAEAGGPDVADALAAMLGGLEFPQGSGFALGR